MAKPGTVIGWKLDCSQRDELLKQHPPRYEQAIADHVTLETNAASKPLPPEVTASIVGRTDDESGVEAMVVTIDGTADRPDGSTYHITWSLGTGRRARESNDVLKERGWKELDHPIPVTLAPARF
jgi:imidazole glycerol phosphate synthase subunit HisF